MGPPFSIVDHRVHRHICGMIKYILFALLLAIIGSGIWFWSKTDPQKLDFADRMAPGTAEFTKMPVTGIAYGTDARQKLDIYTPAGNAGSARPVVIFFHGGAWRDGALAALPRPRERWWRDVRSVPAMPVRRPPPGQI